MGKKRGRPPKPPEETLSERIDIRITSDEKQQWEAAAESGGVTLSEWMRSRLAAASKAELRRSAKQ